MKEPTSEQYKEFIEEYKSIITDLRIKNRKLTTELIQVKEEKAHNEQLLDAFQNVLADFGYKLVEVNDD
jgi:hypothetical protein